VNILKSILILFFGFQSFSLAADKILSTTTSIDGVATAITIKPNAKTGFYLNGEIIVGKDIYTLAHVDESGTLISMLVLPGQKLGETNQKVFSIILDSKMVEMFKTRPDQFEVVNPIQCAANDNAAYVSGTVVSGHSPKFLGNCLSLK
jgi:hypothetical protein